MSLDNLKYVLTNQHFSFSSLQISYVCLFDKYWTHSNNILSMHLTCRTHFKTWSSARLITQEVWVQGSRGQRFFGKDSWAYTYVADLSFSLSHFIMILINLIKSPIQNFTNCLYHFLFSIFLSSSSFLLFFFIFRSLFPLII